MKRKKGKGLGIRLSGCYLSYGEEAEALPDLMKHFNCKNHHQLAKTFYHLGVYFKELGLVLR